MPLPETIPHAVVDAANRTPDATAYVVRQGGEWKETTWSGYVDLVRKFAKALVSVGVGPQDRIALMSSTNFPWVQAAVGACYIGAVPAGIYRTSSAVEAEYILNHSEAVVAVVENADQFAKIAAKKDNLPHLKCTVVMFGDAPHGAISWDEFIASGSSVSDEDIELRLNNIDPAECATMIYTSGTTGPPKAVMLSNNNLVWTASQALTLSPPPGSGKQHSCVSFLPLSHVAEQMFTIHMPAIDGRRVYFAEGLEKLLDNLKEVQPTVFFSPPRLWEKFYAALSSKVPEGVPPEALPAEVKKAMLAGIGMSNVLFAVTGAAPIAGKILEFFDKLGLTILEVYGQSEDNGPTTFNTHDEHKFGTVGKPFPGVEVKIAEDGEILAKGPNVFMGYYKNPEATAETLIDGWMHSGDLGAIDDEGYLHITGRKKDIIITAGGKNITPVKIEKALLLHPLIGQAVVVGDIRPYLIALLTLDPDVVAKVAADKGITPDILRKAPPTLESIQSHIDLVNKDLASVETIKRFEVLPAPFSLEKGEVTPTMKVKRANVNKNYAAVIQAVYDRPRSHE